MSLTLEEYKKFDYRVKCQWCGEWMKFFPTKKTPVKRAPAPKAGYCTGCVDLDHTPKIVAVRRIA